MRFLFVAFLIVWGTVNSLSQTYTSYFTGNTEDIITAPFGGVCLMGGATEDDDAMRWFLERANGGDILVLRTSGSDGYNEYLYSELGTQVNSVETIKFNSADASYDPYVLQRIEQAEAIWFAGGNQWNYVSYWRNSPIDSLINVGIKDRNIVVGGTSAGMAILGKYYFSAENGTVTSDEALSNPYRTDVKVDSTSFLAPIYMENVVTDTHYDDPDRKGRHVVFMSRILTDYGVSPKGIACDEYTAVCIDTNGIAQVFGKSPTFDDNAYFIQPNCELPSFDPEQCTEGMPLDWNLGGQALKVYAVKGTSDGAHTFDMKDWQTGNGGEWQSWYVNNGVLMEEQGNQINCTPLSITPTEKLMDIQLSPNPTSDPVILACASCNHQLYSIEVINSIGKRVHVQQSQLNGQLVMDVQNFPSGLYYLQIQQNGILVSRTSFTIKK